MKPLPLSMQLLAYTLLTQRKNLQKIHKRSHPNERLKIEIAYELRTSTQLWDGVVS